MSLNRIVLFKHGVGYFERALEVDGQATIDLHFNASEMNDVLKSLTVLDQGGGHIASVSYPSTEPIDRQLQDLALQVPPEHALTGLLSQAQGARVRVTAGGNQLEGVVAGIESRRVGDAEHRRDSHLLALLQSEGTLQRVALEEVTELQFLDEDLQRDLRRLLELQITAKRKEEKQLRIFCDGDGKRDVLVGYVVETPVWKTSYRLLLSDDADTQPVVQGWALVDNTKREDWEDVSLTLVAGLPVSFVHDLYSPRYQQRPVVEVKTEAPYAPPELEAAVAMAAAPTGGWADDEIGESPKGLRRAARRKRASLDELKQSVEVQTRTVEVGDLLQYVIDHPVTVRRGEAALVPILQSPFEGQRVAVWNEDVRETNPMTAVHFRNTTELTLEGGPVTVLEEGEYVGEAMLDTLKPGQERFVPYSVELGCRIQRDHKSDTQPVHRIKYSEGTLHLHSHRLRRTIYQIGNDTDRELTLFLEHRFLHGWELTETPGPAESTANFHRFRLVVAAKGTAEFVVRERGAERTTIAMTDVTPDQAVAWAAAGLLEDDLRAALDQILVVQRQAQACRVRLAQVDEAETRATADQARLRDNLGALGSSSDEARLRTRYVKQLETIEDAVESIHKERAEVQQQLRTLEKQLREMVGALEMEE